MDTIELARNAEATIKTHTLYYQHGPGYPLTVACAAIFVFIMKLLGCHNSIYSVNMMSVVFGSLSIAAYYLCARKILDVYGSFWSSLLFVFLPLHVSLTTFGGSQPIFLFFCLLGMYFLFIALDHTRILFLGLSAFFLGCAIAARLPDGLMVGSAIYLYCVWNVQKGSLSFGRVLRRLFFFLGVMSITVLVWYIPMIQKGQLVQMRSFMSAYYMRHSLEYLYFISDFFLNLFEHPIFIFGAIGAIYFFFEKNRLIFYSLLLWFLSLLIYYGTFSCVEARYFLLLLPPAMIMVGYCVSKIFKQWKIITPVVMALIIIGQAAPFYRIFQFRHDHNLCGAFGTFLKKNTEPNAAIIAMDLGLCIEYYGQRRVFYKATGDNKENFVTCFQHIDSMLASHTTVYILTSGIYTYDPSRWFRRGLKAGYDLIYVGSCPMEDWHHNTLDQFIYTERLYKITKKQIVSA